MEKYPHLSSEDPKELARALREIIRQRESDILELQTLRRAVDNATEVFTLTPSAQQDNIAPGLSPDARIHATLLIYPSNTLKLTSIESSGIQNGKIVRIFNAGSDTSALSRLLILERYSPDSGGLNYLVWPEGVGPMFLMPGDWAQFEFDESSNFWRYSTGSREFAALRGQFDQFGDGLSSAEPYGSAASGTGTGFQAGTYLGGDTTERSLGTVGLPTGTDTNGRTHWGTSEFLTMLTGGAQMVIARLAPSSALSDGTNRYQVHVGLHDGSGGTDVVDGAYWEYDDATSPNWRTCTAKASTRTKTTQGPVVSISEFHTLGVFVNYSGTQADFFYQTGPDVVVICGTSHTTNLPGNADYLGVQCGIQKSLGTTSRNLAVDWMGWRQQIRRGN